MNSPTIVMHDRKLPPRRVVRDQCMPIQGLGKYAFAKRSRLHVGHLREAGRRKSGLIDFDNERAPAGFVTVVVRIKKSELRLNEGLGQAFETRGCAEPREAVGKKTRGSAEFLFIAAPDQRIDSVRTDNQIEA